MSCHPPSCPTPGSGRRTQQRSAFTLALAAMTIAGLTSFGGAGVSSAEAESLRPSRGSMNRQTAAARAHDFTYLRNPAHVRSFVEKGYLVRVRPNKDFALHQVSFPYARPEVKLFVERLSRQYRNACGEQLVVTSLTRPRSHQPRNSSPRSVHPTGMALDIRRSKIRKCRRWIERTLLSLESQSILEVTYERRPPHYHLALFPRQYSSYVAQLKAAQSNPRVAQGSRRHRVAPGETLWRIAKKYRTSVASLRSLNRLQGNLIKPGQTLKVPAPR